MIGPDVSEIIQLNEDFILSCEIDGIRIVTKKSDKMLRSLPDSFLNAYPEYLFNGDSTKPVNKIILIFLMNIFKSIRLHNCS